VTVAVRPATARLPLRDDSAVFSATANDTVPAPLPLDPAEMVIQDACACAVHAQPAGIATAIDPVPPDALNEKLDGVSVTLEQSVGSMGESLSQLTRRAVATRSPSAARRTGADLMHH
jgi:hypothetical protein